MLFHLHFHKPVLWKEGEGLAEKGLYSLCVYIVEYTKLLLTKPGMLKVGKAFSGHWLPTNSLSKQQRNCETMVSPMGLFSDSPASDRPPGVFRPGLSLQPVLPRKSPSPCINVIPSFHFPSSKNCHWNFPSCNSLWLYIEVTPMELKCGDIIEAWMA